MEFLFNGRNMRSMEATGWGIGTGENVRTCLSLKVDERLEKEVAGDGFCGYISLERCVWKGGPFTVEGAEGRCRLIRFLRWLIEKWGRRGGVTV